MSKHQWWIIFYVMLVTGRVVSCANSGDPAGSEDDDPSGTSDSDSDADGDGERDTFPAVEDYNPEDGDHSQSGLELSAIRGLYHDPFDVTVTHPQATEIVYTLDGSDPLDSTTTLSASLPATIHIDPADTDNRYLAPGVVLRVVPDSEEYTAPHFVSTHTYLFPARVVELSPNGVSPGGDWPAPQRGDWWSADQYIDYGMDPDVVEDAAYRDQIIPALLDVPTISLVSPLENLFDEGTGIYMNAEERGDDWERPGSVELLNPDGSLGFQANCGIRIRGGYSRSGNNPKHAFRLYFRSEYGVKRLYYPLFEDEGADAFDRMDLRTSQNYSWSFFGSEYNTMNRDVFSRDLQRELGRPYTRSRYYHLYLNGVYWGVFQTQERSESRFARTYFGGDEDEYDVVKSSKISDQEVVIEATNGGLESWEEVWSMAESEGFESDEAYYGLEGRNAAGERVADMKVLVDIDNLIDFMLVIFYAGNFDGPTSSFYHNVQPNNFYAITSRVNPDQGFVFLAHDNEHTLLQEVVSPGFGIDEDRVNIGTIDYGERGDSLLMTVSDFRYFHPQWLHFRLSDNARYRERFAERAREVLGSGGLMTEAPAARLFQSRREELELAIIGESARWGDAQTDGAMGGPTVFTKDEHWTPAVEGILNEFFPYRTEIVVEQLTAAGLY